MQDERNGWTRNDDELAPELRRDEICSRKQIGAMIRRLEDRLEVARLTDAAVGFAAAGIWVAVLTFVVVRAVM